MAKNIKLVVLGSLIYDCVVYGPRLPKRGETVIGTSNGFYFGGKGGNQAVQAARMGAEVYFIGRVGNDETGEKIIGALKKEGIHTDHIIKDDKTATATCCIHVAESGDNAIMIAPLANLQVSVADIDNAMDVILQSDVFLSQLEVNLDAIGYALKKVNQAGIPVVLNPAPASKIDTQIFQYADYLTPNETEAEFFTGILPRADDLSTCRQASEKLMQMGAKNVLITLGSAGSYVASAGEAFLAPALKVDAVDATAAGDAFNAAFTVSLGEGAGLAQAVKYGNAAGAAAASVRGAQPSLGDRKKIERLISEQQ